MNEIELAEGDIVETFKGASFWGRLISIERVDPAKPGGTVLAIAPGFEGTKHVYPLSQLRRRISPLSGDGWQGMETAPIDGSWFLGYRANRYGVQETIDVWHLAKDDEGVFWQNAADSALDLAPTHWRPLPIPPTDEVK